MLNIKKMLAVALLLVITATALPLTSVSAAITGVYLSISAPSAQVVKEGGSISYTLNYTGAEAVMNLTKGHVGLAGFTGDISISKGSGRQMIVTVSNVKGVGEGKFITINGGTAISMADPTKLANGVEGLTFTIEAAKPVDDQKPVLNISAPNPAVVTEGGSVSFTLNYTDNVGIQTINLTQGHIGLVGFTGNVSISGSGNSQRVVTISNVQGTGAGKYITVNGGTAVDTSFLLADGKKSSEFTIQAKPQQDTVAPVLTIEGPSLGRIKEGATLTYVANYKDNVGVTYIGLSAKNIALNGFTADVAISGTGLASRTITLSNIKGAVGAGKNITITGGTAIDAAGNLANAASSKAFEIYKDEVKKDTTSPVLTIAGPSLGRISKGATLTYVANYRDDVAVANISLASNNVVLHGFSADVSISGTGLASRTITLSNVNGAVGTDKYISIVVGTATDAAGNRANSADSNTFEIYEEGSTPQPQPERPTDWIPNPNTGR